jgi:hypothetical protein
VQTLGKNSVIESKIPWLLSATSARSWNLLFVSWFNTVRIESINDVYPFDWSLAVYVLDM